MANQLENVKSDRKTIVLAGLAVLGFLVITMVLLNLAQCNASNATDASDTRELKDYAAGLASKNLAVPVAIADEIPGEAEAVANGVQIQSGGGSESGNVVEPKNGSRQHESSSSLQNPQASGVRENVIQSPSTPPASENVEEPKPQRWVEDTEQVWVVDTPAWSEQIPIYSTVEVSICNVCGADITGNTAAHSKEHMLAGEGSGHHSEVRQNVAGYNTVDHPEVGHWETRVVGGHWE